MKAGDVASWIAIAGALIAVGVTWEKLNSQIAGVSGRLDKIDDRAADQICLSIISRQVAVIEKRASEDVTSRLDKLAEKSGCNKTYGPNVVMTATKAVQGKELQDLIDAQRQLRGQIERELGALDIELACDGKGPFPKGSAGYNAGLDRDNDGVACE